MGLADGKKYPGLLGCRPYRGSDICVGAPRLRLPLPGLPSAWANMCQPIRAEYRLTSIKRVSFLRKWSFSVVTVVDILSDFLHNTVLIVFYSVLMT